jgi:hypothetical protein
MSRYLVIDVTTTEIVDIFWTEECAESRAYALSYEHKRNGREYGVQEICDSGYVPLRGGRLEDLPGWMCDPQYGV